MIEAYQMFVATLSLPLALKEAGALEAVSDQEFEAMCDKFLTHAESCLWSALDAPAQSLSDAKKKLELIVAWYAGDFGELSEAINRVCADLARFSRE